VTLLARARRVPPLHLPRQHAALPQLAGRIKHNDE